MELPMSLFLLLLMLPLALLALGGLVLVVHRLSWRYGLIPIILLLGALTAVLQTNMLGSVNVYGGGGETLLRVPLGSYIVLPALLLGMLVIYVINGSLQSRIVLFQVTLVTILTALLQTLPLSKFEWLGLQIDYRRPAGLPFSLLLASAIALAADMAILVLTYQASTNLRRRFPSRMAGGVALLAGLWADALVFPLLYYSNWSVLSHQLVLNLAGKSLAALLLWPLLGVYFRRVAPVYPGTAATTPRPVLDIFTTTLKLEARARQHYNLLHTLMAVNQLILRANHAQTLLQKTCEVLANDRNYSQTWISLTTEDDPAKVHLAAQTMQDASSAKLSALLAEQVAAVITSGQAWVASNVEQLSPTLAGRQGLERTGCRAAVILPMRHARRIVGALGVGFARPLDFETDTLDLLQEMADDLAYALDSLAVRQRQAILETAADNMQDGLLVTDMNGKIIYVNAANARRLNLSAQELIGRNVSELIPSDEVGRVFETYRQALLRQGELKAEFEYRPPHTSPTYIALRASLINDEAGTPSYVVISVTDITQRRLYEHQLLTLNRIITETVQIHEADDLFNSILQASEELMSANASAIYLLDPESYHIVQTLTHNVPPGYVQRIVESYEGLPGQTALQTLQPVWVEDTLNSVYGERIHFVAESGVRALMVLPLLFQERGLGALVLYYRETHRFDAETVNLGLTLSHTLAIAIENVRLYEGEHSQRQLAEALAQAAISLSSSLDLDEVLDLILQQTQRVALCTSVNIMLIEGKVAYLARRIGYENLPEHLRSSQEFVFPLTLPTLQTMINTGAPIFIPDTSSDPLWTAVDGAKWIKSFAAAPLQVGNQVIGFLNVDSDQPNFFGKETTRRLQAFAAHAAVAIQNARLYQQLQQYANELEQRVRQRTADLQAAKDSIESILASVPDAVLVVDDQGQLLQTNQAGDELLKLAQAHHMDLFAPKFLASLTSSSSLADAPIFQIEGRAFQGSASPLTIDSLHSGTVIAFRDVTRFQELDRIKTRFVSDVSHELRTPLTNLTLYLDLLASTDDKTRQLNYIQTLHRETGRLTHLIEDLLTISRLEAGRLQINLRPTNVNALITELVSDRSLMASDKGLTLLCQPEENLPLAQADGHLLSQSLSNLLTNAINYTPQGGSVCVQTALRQENGVAWVTISVKDTGVGISADEMPRIFERFYRGSASRETGAPGTGLGLAISKEIIDRMGGRITVESALGAGSTFTLWLKPEMAA